MERARPTSAFAPATSTTARKPGRRQRRAADIAPVAIVGDSRILFDTDLDRFQALTGVRPVQLAIVGTNARALLEHLPTTRTSTAC